MGNTQDGYQTPQQCMSFKEVNCESKTVTIIIELLMRLDERLMLCVLILGLYHIVEYIRERCKKRRRKN